MFASDLHVRFSRRENVNIDILLLFRPNPVQPAVNMSVQIKTRTKVSSCEKSWFAIAPMRFVSSGVLLFADKTSIQK